jgi:hypothetical protein
MTDEQLPPRRLLDSDGPAGDCLRRALVERELEIPSFVRLREKRLLRLRVQRAAWALALAAAALVLVSKLRREAPQPSISAERTLAMVAEPPASTGLPRAVVAEPPAVSAVPSTTHPVVAQRARRAAAAASGHGELEPTGSASRKARCAPRSCWRRSNG